MLLDVALSILPILVLLALLVWRRWGVAQAGPAAWLVAVVIAVLRFGAGARLLWLSQLKAGLLALDVLLILWGAFLFFKVVDEAGGVSVIAGALQRLTRDRSMQALVLGWAFSSFLQGVGGFGVPVAVVAPLLVGLGFAAVPAVVIASVGHAWAITFGSFGSSFQALTAASQLAPQALAPTSALMLGLAAFTCGVLVIQAAAGWRAVLRRAWQIAIVGSVMAGVQYALAVSDLWTLAAAAGGLAGLAVGFTLARLTAVPAPAGPPANVQTRDLGLAALGYAILVVTAVSLHLFQPLQTLVGRVVLAFEFPELATARGYVTPAEVGRSINVFGHPGAILAYAALLAFAAYRVAGRFRPGAVRRIVAGTRRAMVPSSLGIVSMMGLALVMSHAGMTEALAQSLASAAGAAFPWFAPVIGALGAFISGSNTHSNVLFAGLQERTAQLIGVGPALVLAAQTTGAAMGAMLAPTRIAVGASTVGLGGQEGLVLRRLAWYALALVLQASVITAVLTRSVSW